MNLTLRQLQVFEAVARLLNYTRAAETLHLSQPAVSTQIRHLEEEVGLPLFVKSGKKIRLTDAGRELYHCGQVVDRELREAESVLDALRHLRRGRLKVAAASTTKYFAPRLMAAFNQRYAGAQLYLDVTNRETLMRLMIANEVDLVLMGQAPESSELVAQPFMENPLVMIAPPDHPLVGRPGIPLSRIAQEVFLVREPGSGTRQATERFFQERGVSFKTGMTMSRNEAIKQGVRAGLGLSVVSIHTVELELVTDRLAILDVEGFPIPRKWYVVYRKGKHLSPMAEAFRRFVLEEARNL